MAYVLTPETDEYLLWNPLTGQCHKQFDPFCPLQSVDCLFDGENVSIWQGWGVMVDLELSPQELNLWFSTLTIY